ncbi:MAG: hypothetical protein JWM47_722, partial [Acidimicrobiales bacterium]|nr:hypothetical protein [Acidimicrobiales bacterium]
MTWASLQSFDGLPTSLPTAEAETNRFGMPIARLDIPSSGDTSPEAVRELLVGSSFDVVILR